MEVLKQNRSAPVPVEKQVAILYAVVHGELKDIAVEQVGEFEQALYGWLDAHAPQYLEAVRTTGKLEGRDRRGAESRHCRLPRRFLKDPLRR